MTDRRADRLRALPPYLFQEIDRAKEEAIARGIDVIDLGVGDPDLPTPEPIRAAMHEAIEDPRHHRYAPGRGIMELREAVASWYAERYRVEIDPEREVLVLIGSKEGIGHLPLALLNPGEKVLVPDPGYPPYRSGTVFAGGEPVAIDLRRENDFLPDLDEIRTVEGARILFLSSPSNPTAAVADLDYLTDLVAVARERGILLALDAAYAEIYFEDPPPSVLEVEGARETAVEFGSLSKTFNMTGWRVAWAVGNREALDALASLKANLDSGAFGAIQTAAAFALRSCGDEVARMRDVYRSRRDAFLSALATAGWDVPVPGATFYGWFPVPGGGPSIEFAGRALDETGVVLTPGVGFGSPEGPGEGWLRVSLTAPEERLVEAARRLAGMGP